MKFHEKAINRYTSLPINVRASFWFLISSFFQRGISVITTPIFTRLMTTSEYGEFSVFYSWYGIFTIFITLNLFFGVYVRGLVAYEDDKDRFTSSLQGLMLTLTIIWFGIYILLRDYFNSLFSLNTFQMIAMFIIIWTNSVYSFWAAEQRVALKYVKLVVISIFTAILVPLCQIILMFFIPNKVLARIIGMVVVSVILYPVLFISQMKRGKCFFSVKYWKYALAFNIPLIPHYLSQTILNSADRLMIKGMVGAAAAGIYSLAYSISQIMTVFNTAMMQTIEPWLYKKIKNKQVNEISKVAYPAFIIVAAVNIFLIAFAPELIMIFAPLEYYDAIWIIPPVAMSVFFMFTYTFFAVFEFYYKKTHLITTATLIGALINIVLNYIFIKKFGYYAAGYTTLLCYILYSVFHYIFMKKLASEHFPGIVIYDNRILITIISSFMILGFILLMLYKNAIIRYLIIIGGLLLIFFKKSYILNIVKTISDTRKLESD